ncbi:MAG: histidine phosphatase family protein [Candidatus Nanoarchaeia archaeon]
MTKIILIRHCETVDNVKGLMQGYHNDSELSETGLQQAQKLSNRLHQEKISAVYCSDLGRTFKTAQIISAPHDLKPIPIRDLRECDIGEWNNLPVKEAIKKWIKYYEEEKQKGGPREEIRPPNGENSFDHQKRVMSTLRKIITDHSQQTIVIVGHAGTNKVIIGSFNNADPDDFYKIEQKNGCINIIDTNENKILIVNDVVHLKDETN